MAFKMIQFQGLHPVLVIVVAVLCIMKTTEGISCLECNAYFQGRPGTSCAQPHNRTDCNACLKVVTKVKMHDGWLIRRTSAVETKYCVRVANSPGLREEGCYYQVNNGGYTQRCFCYSDGCNKGTSTLLSSTPVGIYAVLSLALSLFWMW